MQRRDVITIGACLGALLVASVVAPAAWADEPAINIDNFTFSPAVVTVPVGTKLKWTNRDDIPHTVTDAAEKRAFKSAPLDTGDTFSFVFTSPGTYHYFCSLHPHMQGTVVVQ